MRSVPLSNRHLSEDTDDAGRTAIRGRETRSRAKIAATLYDAADQIESGSVHLEIPATEQPASISDELTFEVELERITNSETGQEYYELEYELSWVDNSA